MNRANPVRVTAKASGRIPHLPFLLLTLLGVWLLGAQAARASSEPWPELPSPPKAKVQWVAESMRVNGVPMRVQHFDSQAPRSEIVEYYRAYWTGGGYPMKPSVRALDDSIVVGQMHGPYLMTIKVKDGPHGTSEGLISVSRVLGSKVERSPGELPLMPGARVAQVVESYDAGRASREVLVSNPQGVPLVVSYYQSALGEAGWRQVQYNDVPRTAGTRAGTFMAFLREDKEMQLSVVGSPDGRGSTVSASIVTKDTGPQDF
jgi:hypothetical protein